MQPAEILRAGWGVDGTITSLGAGHINDTYLAADGRQRWVLQRINRQVFVDPHALMDNVERIVKHISAHAPGFVAALVPTLDGRALHEEDDGCWRLSQYVANTRTQQSIEGVAQARAAGRAFARYQNLLSDLPEPPLHDPIAGFMRLGTYLTELAEAPGRGNTWGNFIAARAPLQNVLQECDGYIHGDCKVNNLLFAADSDEVACVVDLDTTMRGHWAWDFGDLVRSGAAQADGFSLALFAALAEGFVGEKSAPVSPADLVTAPRYVCFMLGVRFLTDHLCGDRYFKVSRHGENLARAERQFRLLEAMEAATDDMLRLVGA
jgi:Ser/Thr protein kinase RdoA (MazF antagonist)